MFLKQSTAFTIEVGPILDSAGAEYASAVIGDLTIVKNGVEAAMAAAATLTYNDNGHYELVGTTGNSDTVGTLQIRCNKAGYQMPPVALQVVETAVFDAYFANTAPGYITDQPVNAIKLAGQTITAATGVTFPTVVANEATFPADFASLLIADKLLQVNVTHVNGTAYDVLTKGDIAQGVWAELLPGSYTAGMAGYHVGNGIPAVFTAVGALSIPTANQNRDAVMGAIIEASRTLRDCIALLSARELGASSGGPGSPAYKGLDGTTVRVSATVDANGNRSGVTLTPA